MRKILTDIPGLILLEPTIHCDERGWFVETYHQKDFLDLGIDVAFVQDNHSYSKRKHTLRGLHFQLDPMSQAKLLRCVRGSVIDVAVDLRVGSPTWLKWQSFELSMRNQRQLFIPRGFAHAILTLEDDSEVIYKVDNFYSEACSRSIYFNDPQIGIDWGDIDPILSWKDRHAPLLADSDVNFTYEETSSSAIHRRQA